MIEESIINFIKDVGFPIFIAVILIYDKVKSNGSLKKVVENNNEILNKIYNEFYNDGRKKRK